MNSQEQDIPWKEILEIYFQDFLLFFLPGAHTQVDWTHKPEFLDKEFQKLIGEKRGNKKILDKLVRVNLKNGGKKIILVHIEIQGSYEKDFSNRMLLYYFRIWEKYKSPIASIAVLTDERKNWKPKNVKLESWDTNLNFEYKVFKLTDYESKLDVLKADKNVFSIVVLAHLKAIETRRDVRKRLNWKIWLIKLLYERGYKKEAIHNLFYFINWILVLPEEYEKGVENQIKKYEESKKVAYITNFEKMYIKRYKEIGLKEGMEKGMEKGKQEGIQLGLEIKFNDKGLKLYKSIEKIHDINFLESFMQEIKKANDIKVLKEYIQNYKQSKKKTKAKKVSVSSRQGTKRTSK